MDEYQNNIGYLLNKAAKLSKWHLGIGLDQYGLTAAQWAVLKDLTIHAGADIQSRTPAAIAQRLHSDRPTISGIIVRLSKKGLIGCFPNPEDRRSQIIQITEEALSLIPKLEAATREAGEQILKGFDPQEADMLRGYLRRVIDNLSE